MRFLIGIHLRKIDDYRVCIDGLKVLHLPELEYYDIWFNFENVSKEDSLLLY